jgi:hypothetical protein
MGFSICCFPVILRNFSDCLGNYVEVFSGDFLNGRFWIVEWNHVSSNNTSDQKHPKKSNLAMHKKNVQSIDAFPIFQTLG